MNVEDFCEISGKELLRRREAYENGLLEKCEKARKRFFAYKTAANHIRYRQALKRLKLQKKF